MTRILNAIVAISIVLAFTIPADAFAARTTVCEAELGSWEDQINWRIDSGENLTNDYVYTRQLLPTDWVFGLGKLDRKSRIKFLNRLNEEIIEIKESVSESELEESSQEYQAAKQPARNRQLMRMILLQPEMNELRDHPTVEGVEKFLNLLTSGRSKGKFSTVLETVRKVQREWGRTLQRGEWVEILGSWPNLEANTARSDIDIFLSRKLEWPYRRAVRGKMFDEGTLAKPIRRDRESLLIRSRFLNLEEYFRAAIDRPIKPGHLLSVAVRSTTVRKGQILIDESDAIFRRFMTMISPISILISKDELILRINDGISPGKDRGPKVAKIPL